MIRELTLTWERKRWKGQRWGKKKEEEEEGEGEGEVQYKCSTRSTFPQLQLENPSFVVQVHYTKYTSVAPARKSKLCSTSVVYEVHFRSCSCSCSTSTLQTSATPASSRVLCAASGQFQQKARLRGHWRLEQHTAARYLVATTTRSKDAFHGQWASVHIQQVRVSVGVLAGYRLGYRLDRGVFWGKHGLGSKRVPSISPPKM